MKRILIALAGFLAYSFCLQAMDGHTELTRSRTLTERDLNRGGIRQYSIGKDSAGRPLLLTDQQWDFLRECESIDAASSDDSTKTKDIVDLSANPRASYLKSGSIATSINYLLNSDSVNRMTVQEASDLNNFVEHAGAPKGFMKLWCQNVYQTDWYLEQEAQGTDISIPLYALMTRYLPTLTTNSSKPMFVRVVLSVVAQRS